MGLKTITFASFKNGKTVFALSAAQIGPVGYIDNEYHARPYLMEHTTIPQGSMPFPFNMPMQTCPDLPMCVSNPIIGAAFGTTNPVFLVETQELDTALEAVKAFGAHPSIVTIVTDSGSVFWDLTGDMADEAHEESLQKNIEKGKGDFSTLGRLAWNKPKKYNRRVYYAQMRCGKHIIHTAHVQEEYKNNKPTGRIQPWLEKKSPHWADLVVEIALPGLSVGEDGKPVTPVPSILVVGDNLAGRGGITRGKVIQNATFKHLIDATGMHISAERTGPSEEEAAKRNAKTVEHVASASTGLTDKQEEKATYPHKG